MLGAMMTGNDRNTFWLLLAAGLIVRIIYFFEYRSLLEFSCPTVDALYHHLTARAIASGGLVSTEPFFRAPFYNYFLALIYFVSDNSIAFARFVQLALGAFSIPLTYVIAKRMFDQRVAMIAAILVLATADLVYFDGELLLESSVLLMLLLLIWSLLKYLESRAWNWLALAGLIQGLAIINRPNTAVFVPVALWLMWRTDRPSTASGHVTRWLGFLWPLAIPIVLVLWHNLTRSEPTFSIATQGGINFYIGNNPEADGVSAVMPGELGYAWQYADIKYLAESEAGKSLTADEISGFYFRRGLDFIASEPAVWLKLMLKKTYLLFSGADISNNRNLPFFKSQTVMLRILPVGMGVLAPLGLVGMWLARRRSPVVSGLAVFAVLYGLTFVAFFVNSRFRLPLLPLLAIFSAFVLMELWDRRRAGIAGFLKPVSVVILLGLVLNTNLYRMQFDNRQQALFSRGNLLLDAGRTGEAIAEYHHANAGGPPLQQVNLNLGLAFLKLGQFDSAWHYFLVEDSLFAGSAEAMNNLAYLYRQTEQFPEAIIAARAALEEKPYLAEARLNLWYALRESGRSDSAYAAISAYAAEHQLTNSEKFIAAVTSSDLRRYDEAERQLRELAGSQQARTALGYSEASNLTRTSDRLAPALFESRVLYNLGFVLGSRGQMDSAIVYLNRATELDPMLSEAWVNLGSAYFAVRRYPQAIAAFEHALTTGPPTAVLTFNLSLSYLAVADTVTARQYLAQCLQIQPGFGPATALAQALRIENK